MFALDSKIEKEEWAKKNRRINLQCAEHHHLRKAHLLVQIVCVTANKIKLANSFHCSGCCWTVGQFNCELMLGLLLLLQ